MQNTVFLINDRFLIDTERNELLDKTSGEKNHLEPRLMKLLHLLIQHQDRVVKRECIIKEIWNDYPGASEGLNQAISFLRKILVDEHKAIIQTQPKVGYSLHAIISQVGKRPLLFRKKHVPLMIGVVVLILLLFFAVDIYIRINALPPDNKQLDEQDAQITKQYSTRQRTKMKRLLKDTLGPAAKGDSLRTN